MEKAVAVVSALVVGRAPWVVGGPVSKSHMSPKRKVSLGKLLSFFRKTLAATKHYSRSILEGKSSRVVCEVRRRRR